MAEKEFHVELTTVGQPLPHLSLRTPASAPKCSQVRRP